MTMRRAAALALLLCLAGAGPAVAAEAGSRLAAVWAGEGGDKVLRHERRAAAGPVRNSVWDGTTVRIFGARNEVVNFNLVLESAEGASEVSVSLDRLAGPGAEIRSQPARGDGVFDWVGRDIELFVVRYLQIRGLSKLSYDAYDERHIPSKLRRPLDANGNASGGWRDRPGADRFFPEIAVPHELVRTFSIAAGENQSVWVDVYVPKGVPAGTYSGQLSIREHGRVTKTIPVQLTVRDFALPDAPAAKTMVSVNPYDVSERYTGERWADGGTREYEAVLPVLRRHWQMLRRHKLTPVADPSRGYAPPPPDVRERLTGRTYLAAAGYAGPGQGLGDDVYAVGFYGGWPWKKEDAATFHRLTDDWERWFQANAPGVERFLYLIDEPDHKNAGLMAEINGWVDKLGSNPGPGRNLPTLVTMSTEHATEVLPRVNISASWYSVANTAPFQRAVEKHLANPRNRIYQYNGKRPASGSFAIEDDGVSPRMLPWAQWKKGIARWFYWESTYYFDYQTKNQRVNVWREATTFGTMDRDDPVLGRTGYNNSNGDGVLFYPGTDRQFPADSLGVAGPMASLRMKYWRRGVQDADYVALAHAANPTATRAIVERMVPKVLWEVGVAEPGDPTWVRGDISWSIDPDDWEAARRQLADLIEAKGSPKQPEIKVSAVAGAATGG